MPHMHFGRPEVPVGKEAVFPLEAHRGSFPVFQVGAGIYIKPVRRSPAGGSAGAVEIVASMVHEHKRIADVDIFPVHAASVSG